MAWDTADTLDTPVTATSIAAMEDEGTLESALLMLSRRPIPRRRRSLLTTTQPLLTTTDMVLVLPHTLPIMLLPQPPPSLPLLPPPMHMLLLPIPHTSPMLPTPDTPKPKELIILASVPLMWARGWCHCLLHWIRWENSPAYKLLFFGVPTSESRVLCLNHLTKATWVYFTTLKNWHIL